ncbi:MAG: hypothetical protein ISR96_01935 [Nitrospira sp.]|nr:hypothetical protein [bacterium]MBL7048277.1 hypothetical protein [Nitrospira sp.]
MNYFKYVKPGLISYVTAGVVLAVTLFSLIAAYRYNDYLSNVRQELNDININKYRVKQQGAALNALSESFMLEFGIDAETMDPELKILEAVDKIKKDLADAEVIVGSIEEVPGYKELSVTIKKTMTDYKMIIEFAEYVESWKLPDFQIRNFSVAKTGTGSIDLSIDAALSVPVL